MRKTANSLRDLVKNIGKDLKQQLSLLQRDFEMTSEKWVLHLTSQVDLGATDVTWFKREKKRLIVKRKHSKGTWINHSETNYTASCCRPLQSILTLCAAGFSFWNTNGGSGAIKVTRWPFSVWSLNGTFSSSLKAVCLKTKCWWCHLTQFHPDPKCLKFVIFRMRLVF